MGQRAEEGTGVCIGSRDRTYLGGYRAIDEPAGRKSGPILPAAD